MHCLDAVVRACPRPALRNLIVATLLAPACGPSPNPGATDTSTPSTGEAMTTSAGSSPTDPGGPTSSTSASAATSLDTSPSSSEPGPFTSGFGFDCGFAVGDDGRPRCSIDPTCDVFLQDCPEGQKCAAVITDDGGAWNATRCVPVTGDDVAGNPCTAESVADGLDSCAKGNMCWQVDGNGDGTCIALCMGTVDAPICPDMGLCTVANNDVLNLCLPDCDPVLQDCDPDGTCLPIGDGFNCAPSTPEDTSQANDPCHFINMCESGLFCADPAFVGAGCPDGSPGCCTPFCEFPDGACPNPDQQCVQWFDPKTLLPDDPKLHIGSCGVAP